MANTIEIAKRYTTLLDEQYKKELTSSVLSIPNEFVRNAQGVGEILLPKVSVDGLGDYDRGIGYPEGSVNFTWETHSLSQDRAVEFTIDRQDNEEALDSVFTFTSGQFARTKVSPELDAYRYAQLANIAPADQTVDADLDNTNTVEAIETALVSLDNNEVPREGLYLFASPQTVSNLRNSDLFERNIINIGDRTVSTYDGIPIIKVPQGRFTDAITLNDGSTSFGYTASGNDINFMLVHQSAGLPIVKQRRLKVFDPNTNQKKDGWLMQSRVYHDIFTPDNKIDGIYVHTVAIA